jgi:eukaryotic translation initiation factor 2-alpha kinase 4
MQSDTKIFREIHALSRLSHRYIVRYYTTWVETSDPSSTAASSAGSESETDDGTTSVPSSAIMSRRVSASGEFSFRIYDDADLDGLNGRRSYSKGSFPSIRFERAATYKDSSDESDDSDSIEEHDSTSEEEDEEEAIIENHHPPLLQRTMYIQMVHI